MNELEKTIDGIVNFHISVHETSDRVVFLRKLAKGGSEHSFGIHVAKMAGVPLQVLHRAEEILADLEKDRAKISGVETLKSLKLPKYQLSLFGATDPKMDELRKKFNSFDINALTPIDALMKLHEIKNLLN